MTELRSPELLPEQLRELVQESGRILGDVIRLEAGKKAFTIVENLRAKMADLRDQEPEVISAQLRQELVSLRKLSAKERHTVGRAFTLFLELMNSCENAYRSLRLREKNECPLKANFTLVYVLTAHPTEARSPENIAIFQGVQEILFGALLGECRWQNALKHQLGLAWRAYPTRQRVPMVRDEAEHIYRSSLRPEILRALLAVSQDMAPFYLRTWVGGDKDGHPGVDDKAMSESLSLSRGMLVDFAMERLGAVADSLNLIPAGKLEAPLKDWRKTLVALRVLKAGDGARVKKARLKLLAFSASYEREFGVLHPALVELKRLFHIFPALVVPLELREASDVLMEEGEKAAPIKRMLKFLSQISRGGDPRWYARGFIVSMTESVDHLVKAEAYLRRALGKTSIPVIPLFETVPSLQHGPEVVEAFMRMPRSKANLKRWQGKLEIMVGYSDSSKQGGVFPSRLAIAGAMHRLEAVVKAAGYTPIFFQGSGGSVDRGGGSVEDQVAWWPRTALETYKVTIQGEMVERSFSSPEITRGQLGRITKSVERVLQKQPRAPQAAVLFLLAERVRAAYEKIIHERAFLEIVGNATPYPFLSELKIGSRPARRTTEVSVAGLRAIPWVLCWTQTRVLFQTWWGVGCAWQSLTSSEREELRVAFKEEPVFASFIKALGFTLAKVELPLWAIYLENSGLPKSQTDRFLKMFSEELERAKELVAFCSESENLLWFRPWLGASIRLRSPMIHPLNLLQVLALEDGDFSLFRTTATGISAGMMTTG